jgi:hypothetical protein
VTKRVTQAKIDELRSKTPHADLDDLGVEIVGIVEGADPVAFNDDISAYLKRFAKPENLRDRHCVGCGEHMGGFVWGLVHGHGHCRNCGWPATPYHFIKDRDGKDLATVRGVLLQVHPNEVSVRKQP